MPELKELVALGLPALPHIIKKMEQDPNDFHLAAAIWRLTRKGFERSDYPDYRVAGLQARARLYVQWWREGRQETPARFERLYREWHEFKTLGEATKAEARFLSIVKLGLDALPLIMQKVEAGDAGLLPAVAHLTDKGVPNDATPADAAKWWAANKEKWTLPPVKVDSERPTTRPAAGLPAAAQPTTKPSHSK